MKNSILLSFLLFLTGQGLCSQVSVQSTSYQLMLKTLLDHSVPELGVQEVQQLDDCIFLDAREIGEYEMSHIQGAEWVGYDDFDISRVDHVDKSQKVIVYCSVGYRSEKISEQLIENGFSDVSNLYGGIFEWGNADLPVVNDSGVVNEIHPYDRTWGLWLKKTRRGKL